jgi:hypothetical protein
MVPVQTGNKKEKKSFQTSLRASLLWGGPQD